jgi:hypothetical protein
MIIPTMPEGYYLIQESGFWYILKDEGLFLKRLLDSQGNEIRFEPTTKSLAQAALYAQKHKDAGLHYNQEVSEP